MVGVVVVGAVAVAVGGVVVKVGEVGRVGR